MNHACLPIQPLHWSSDEFYLRQSFDGSGSLTQPFFDYERTKMDGVVAIFRVRPKYIAKQVTAADVTKVIERTRDRFARMYEGQYALKVEGIDEKMDAAQEIFDYLFSEINKTFQA